MAKIFTILDANWGYRKLAVRKEVQGKKAFCSREELYEFLRMLFELTNVPASLKSALDVLLA